uniref:C-type lectin domain-containing protein n=1 Tax=Dromaius novaehollandiae TaxID=8790 RepID=A0A8C4J7R3_DRONO
MDVFHIVSKLENGIYKGNVNFNKAKILSCSSTWLSEGARPQRSAWFYVAVILGILVLVLLGVMAVLPGTVQWEYAQVHSAMARDWETEESRHTEAFNPHSTASKPTPGREDELLLDRSARQINLKCYRASKTRATCELCPPGWQLHRGRCYYFSEEAVSWDDSQRNCLSFPSLSLLQCSIVQQILSSTEFEADHSLGSFCSLIRIVLNRIEADKNCAVYRRKNMIQTDNCQTFKKWICKKNATLLAL